MNQTTLPDPQDCTTPSSCQWPDCACGAPPPTHATAYEVARDYGAAWLTENQVAELVAEIDRLRAERGTTSAMLQASSGASAGQANGS